MPPMSGAERRQVLPLVLLAIVVFIWASNTIISKLALQEATPVLLALVRFSLAALCFHLPVFLLTRRFGAPLRRGEWVRLAAAGMLGSGSSVLFFTIGVATTPATYAGLILMTAPIWTALLARLFLGERLGLVRALGMGLAFVGAGVLATDGQLDALDAGIVVGSGFLLLAQICWGGYTLLSKPLLSRRPPLLVLAISHLLALGALWPATLALGAWAELPRVLSWSLSTWVAVLYMVVVVTGLSQALYIYGLRAVDASRAISFMYLQPAFTAVLAALVLDERLTPLTFLCGSLILLGLWLVNRREAPRPARRVAQTQPAVGRR